MFALIILIAVAYACARGIEAAAGDIAAKHQERMKKAADRPSAGRRAGAKAAGWAATGGTAASTFGRGFKRGWKNEWPRAKERARAKFDKAHEPARIGDDIGADGAPVNTATEHDRHRGRDRHHIHGTRPDRDRHPDHDPKHTTRKTTEPDNKDPDPHKLRLVKDHPTKKPTTGDSMALANIPEITGVETLKSAVARTASESGVSAEEAGAIAQRAQEELAAIEAMIEQATALEFDDDGGTIDELAGLRDQAQAALGAAQALQQAMVDKAALAAQSSKNIHDRHGVIQEAVAANGGRMASKQAYVADA